MRRILLVAAALLATAQTPRPAFDAASVKLNTAHQGIVRVATFPTRLSAVNANLRLLLRYAYNLPDFRMIGGPDWMDTERFDIEGSAGATVAFDDIRAMTRTMLEDRFKLRAHLESRDQPIMLLTVARRDGKLGDQIKPSSDECLPIVPPKGFPPPPPPPPGGAPREGPGCPSLLGAGAVSGRKLSIDRLITTLSPYVNRVIVDRTNLSGVFDLELRWLPDMLPFAAGAGLPPPPIADPDAPPLFTAIQEQLGLKLESARGPVDVLVIDGVEKPTPD
jgi:uncharacterized protein (TIGR03435 family)